tara:strand:- start:335 stop:763 length:429 start_codon:yes stop_codon:yes gene_type:complete
MPLPLMALAGPLMQLAGPIIDSLFPDPAARADAKAKIMAAELAGETAQMETALSAIVMEAKSADPWTSRARPSFLYVMYMVIVLCFVGGIIGIWWPDHVATAASNITNLLAAIPDALWTLFGAGYLGYAGGRTFEKVKGVAK